MKRFIGCDERVGVKFTGVRAVQGRYYASIWPILAEPSAALQMGGQRFGALPKNQGPESTPRYQR